MLRWDSCRAQLPSHHDAEAFYTSNRWTALRRDRVRSFFHCYAALENRSAIPIPFALNGDLPKRGVELFFAISGFILGVPFASHYISNAPKVKLKQYFLRRLTRLEPPYFLSLLVWMAAQWVSARRPVSDMLPHFAAHMVYLHNFIYGAFAGPVNGVAWSLESKFSSTRWFRSCRWYLRLQILACAGQ